MAYENASPSSAPGWRAATGPVASTDGVITRRFFAYLVDLLVISALFLLFAFLVGLAGLFTFGLAWTVFPILGPVTAIFYNAVTVGGARQGTIGMRACGVAALDASTGGRPGMLQAGLHALLFYVAVGVTPVWVIDVIIGLVRPDRRLGHDLLADLAFVRR